MGVVATACALSACGGSARFVVRDDEGGLFALDGDVEPARRDAERQMAEHCGPGRYRVVFDGSAALAVGRDRGPSAAESAGRMALPSDLPGALELSGTSPAGGAGVTNDGELFLHDPARADRAAPPRIDRRRRLEYECTESAVDDHDSDVRDEPDRVAIPAQRFEIGSPESDSLRDPDEGPRQSIDVGSFAIDRTPVTVRAFERRLAEVRAAAPTATILTEAETPEAWIGRCNLGSDRADHPMNCVSVDAARAYCRLLSADLPTEAERELAARGGSGTRYAWGDDFDGDRAVSSVGCAMRGCRGGTARVVTDGPRCNALGLCDLSGNVWEWTLTEYAPELGAYTAIVPPDGATIATPVHRGGSWLDEDARRFRSSFRGIAYPENGLTGVGFRCATRD